MPCLARAKTACARCPMKKISDDQVGSDNINSEKVHHGAELFFSYDCLCSAKIQSKALGSIF